MAGLLDGRPLVATRPVRAPHCTISDAALLGGGSPIRPGEVTLAHLAPEKRRALWVEHKWLDCTPRSSRVRERLELYGAIAARDAHAMLARARALLAGPAQGGDEWGRYLLGTAMLGAYAAGEHEEGLRLWKTYRSTFYPRGEIPPHMVYLANLQ